MRATPYFALMLFAACGGAPTSTSSAATAPVVAPEPTLVVAVDEVDWQQLNPARGDASPMAATLWGDRNGPPATGFLFHAVDGFSSPPHIHNVSYRALVIGGVIHNDHPDAAELWMPQGSYWTQPNGAVHITAARGDDVLALVEIDEGPYLVRPVEDAFDNGEQAVNVLPDDIAWNDGNPRIAELWGEPEAEAPSGRLVGFGPGEGVSLEGSGFRVVVIRGDVTVGRRLAPGSYVMSHGERVDVTCEGGEACVLYVRQDGPIELRAAE